MAQIATLAPAAQRWQRMLAPAITIGGLSAATVALHFRDPHASGSWGMCPSAMLGIACPGCGGLRAVNDLTNFQLVDAASSNLLFVLALPLVLFALVRWVTDQWRGTTRTTPAWAMGPAAIGVVAVLVVFTVLRNLPQFAWLAP
ncbi:MAG TPA: DUF2752 domain-containing protein [Nocardioides sp.]|nr:DUF2752 domain-containing protein [Nocardioides sp.]